MQFVGEKPLVARLSESNQDKDTFDQYTWFYSLVPRLLFMPEMPT